MINKVKEFFKTNIDKIKYLYTNNWIRENRIDMLGKCFKYDTKQATIYIKLVSVNNETKTFTALTVHIPKEMKNDIKQELVVTNKYGPYGVGDSVPYTNICISFVDNLEVSKIDENLSYEISNIEFGEALTGIMDNILKIGI